MRIYPPALVVICVFGLCLSAVCLSANAQIRPSTEYRSLNTAAYEISVQKNGRVDVHLVSGETVFANAYPMVWFEGEEEAERLPVDGRLSAREAVDDPLGRGQGLMLQKRECEWHIRAYPTRTFFAVQVAYTNTKKRPVTVRALLPWCAGTPKSGGVFVGSGAADAVLLEPHDDRPATLMRGSAEGDGHLAIVNPSSGRSLIAGFIAQERGRSFVAVGDVAENGFERFRAATRFDPPVELAPGETLRSGVLYVAVAEANPLEGLERYARAMGIANRISIERPSFPSGYLKTPAQSLETIHYAIQFMRDKTAPFDFDSVLDSNVDPTVVRSDGSPPLGAALLLPSSSPATAWRASLSSVAPGIVESVRAAARRYYLSPFIAQQSMPIDLHADPALTDDQRLAALTAASLFGGPLLLSGDITAIDPQILRRVLPPARRSARPIDLFDGGTPRVWVLGAERATNTSAVACVFNWNADGSQRMTLPFLALGLDPSDAYSVFDFWRGEYQGVARGSLFVDVPPGAVRVLVFRRHADRPMVVATDARINQFGESSWDPATRRLGGTIEAVSGIPYRVYIRVPERFSVEEPIEHEDLGKGIVAVQFRAEGDGPLAWSAHFTESRSE